MQLDKTNKSNYSPNFKQLYASEEALKLLKISRKELNEIPILKKYSKDFDFFIKTSYKQSIRYGLCKLFCFV